MESLIVALGTGKTDDNGKKIPFEVQEGRPRARQQMQRHGNQTGRQGIQDPRNSDDMLASIEWYTKTSPLQHSTIELLYGSKADRHLMKPRVRPSSRECMEKLSRAVKATLGPKGRNVVSTQSRLAHASPRTASPSPRKSNWKTLMKTWAPRWSAKSPARRATPRRRPARRQPPCSRRGHLQGRPEERHHMRRQPHQPPARHPEGRGRSRWELPRQDLQEGQGQGRNQAGRDRFRQLGHDHQRNDRRRDGQGRQGRHHHG